ncbi:MAG: hypothetical protein J6M91_09185 [Methanobrevibacter sp.]|nr:hypothetical protein [Methanobrevibacter sp.]
MNENIAKIEAKGFQDLCNYIRELEEKNKFLESENAQLKANTALLGNELTYFKEYSADLEDKVQDLKKQYDEFYEKEYLKRIDECNDLWGQLFDIKHMSLWEFANKYCKTEDLEEAGHELAKSLLGGA